MQEWNRSKYVSSTQFVDIDQVILLRDWLEKNFYNQIINENNTFISLEHLTGFGKLFGDYHVDFLEQSLKWKSDFIKSTARRLVALIRFLCIIHDCREDIQELRSEFLTFEMYLKEILVETLNEQPREIYNIVSKRLYLFCPSLDLSAIDTSLENCDQKSKCKYGPATDLQDKVKRLTIGEVILDLGKEMNWFDVKLCDIERLRLVFRLVLSALQLCDDVADCFDDARRGLYTSLIKESKLDDFDISTNFTVGEVSLFKRSINSYINTAIINLLNSKQYLSYDDRILKDYIEYMVLNIECKRKFFNSAMTEDNCCLKKCEELVKVFSPESTQPN